jgi:hypothetical protein
VLDLPIDFVLPDPWQGKRFAAQSVGAINFLVGPNGSGKSRFGVALKAQYVGARLLNTDRLEGMEGSGALRRFLGDHMPQGLSKNHFPQFKQSGTEFGSGMDTFILLEERLDLRIQVEATLSHLFNRLIMLEWDSGNLVAKATEGAAGKPYRLDRDECHGIKELLVMLTHLYNEESPYLIIDEPELNLHPQYQAFFMQEVRRVAGDPRKDKSKKVVFLITHSPFILDFKSVDDVKSVLSFDLQHSVPRQLLDLGAPETARLKTLVPRLNVHHKQLFFSDNPVFVEGILDAQLVAAVQEARGVSIAAAGSCIIDAGGNEEVNHYLDLCIALGKNAYFLYDLDSLFRGNLRGCIRPDGGVQSFLAAAGVGADFTRYCGELDRILTSALDTLVAAPDTPAALAPLIAFLKQWGPKANWASDRLAKGRVAVVTAISRKSAEMITVLSPAIVSDIEGRMQQICAALRQKNVLLLPGGTLERYMPSYTGDHYAIADEAKSAALQSELTILAGGLSAEALAARYGVLYELICALPSKDPVDADPVLMGYLSDYIHSFQSAVITNKEWRLDEFEAFMSTHHTQTAKVFALQSFTRGDHGSFNSTVRVSPMLGQETRYVTVTEQTNAGMRKFELRKYA